METREELMKQRNVLCEECNELHDAYMRTGNKQILEKIADKEAQIRNIEKTIPYRKGQFSKVVEELKKMTLW